MAERTYNGFAIVLGLVFNVSLQRSLLGRPPTA